MNTKEKKKKTIFSVSYIVVCRVGGYYVCIIIYTFILLLCTYRYALELWRLEDYILFRYTALFIVGYSGRAAAVMYTETDGRQQVLSRRNAVSIYPPRVIIFLRSLVFFLFIVHRKRRSAAHG